MKARRDMNEEVAKCKKLHPIFSMVTPLKAPMGCNPYYGPSLDRIA